MRLIIPFNGNEITVAFENIARIIDYADHIVLVGDLISIRVNAMDICTMATVTIQKSWLLLADDVYLDTRIEEGN